MLRSLRIHPQVIRFRFLHFLFLQTADAKVVVGSFVWVEDSDQAWVEGEVVKVEKKKVTVKVGDKETVYRLKHIHPKDPDAPSGGVDDMTKLAYLHEPGVLHNLAVRYSLDEIYTYTGSILIAVNPFQRLPHLYDVHMMEQYRGSRLGELSPHVFAIAETSFRAMVDYKLSQSILVSGESGAGKTETTKLLMQYLAYMGGRATEGRSVEAQVLESNPLLEAFGNAKTVRNNNSSRFGKFVEIQFDESGRISGAAVRTYLLERSRVVQISDPERNYHCFYQLCSGASPEVLPLRYAVGIQFDESGRISGAAVCTMHAPAGEIKGGGGEAEAGASRDIPLPQPEQLHRPALPTPYAHLPISPMSPCAYEPPLAPQEVERLKLAPAETFHYLNQSSCIDLPCPPHMPTFPSHPCPHEVEKLKLAPAETFHYLNQSNCFELPGKETNADEYIKTRRAMDVVGLSPEEQDSIFQVVAAILHLGNITFAPGKQPDSSKVSGDKSKYHLEAAASLLRVDKKQLRESLISRTLVTRDGNIKKELDPAAALISRDTLAKTIYARLFDWLVDKVNKSIGQDPNAKTIIGVLDIYGFETFQCNSLLSSLTKRSHSLSLPSPAFSFEQFCINLANEKLQQHFNHHVFKAEQEEYEKEEINWSYIEFVDNQDVLELIEKKPMGIISLLDEQCMFPKSNHETFATKLYQTVGTHARFEKPKLSQTDFTIDHYAGKVWAAVRQPNLPHDLPHYYRPFGKVGQVRQVTYQTDLFLEKSKDYVVMEHRTVTYQADADLFLKKNKDYVVTYQTDLFLEKNKDYVVMEHQTVLSESKDPFVAGLFPIPAGDKAKTKFTSLGSSFKQQLAELMATLNQTQPNYIRCVKPNGMYQPQLFENVNVIHQLRCGGVLEAIRISCAGYPTRRTFDEFLDRFSFLDPEACDGSQDDKTAITTLLDKLGFANYQVGKTQVFLRAGQMADLDAMRAEKLGEAAKVIQRAFKAWMQRRVFQRLRAGVLRVQALWRGHKARLQYESIRRNAAAVRVQKHVRRFVAQSKYRRTRQAAVVLQSGARGMAARKEARQRRENRAAVKIQSKWRGHVQQQEYGRRKKSALVLQSSWRGRAARLELKKLKHDAKQTGALQEAKTKLEKQCEELTWRLQLEKRMRLDVEEAKTAEIQKLQQELEGAMKKVDEAHAETLAAKAEIQAAKAETERLSLELATAAQSAQIASQSLDLASTPAAAAAAATTPGSAAKVSLSASASAAPTGAAVAAAAVAGSSPPHCASSTPGSPFITPRKSSFPGATATANTHSTPASSGSFNLGSAALNAVQSDGAGLGAASSRELAVENAQLKALLAESDERVAQVEAEVREEICKRERLLEETQEELRKVQELCARLEEQVKNAEQENQVLRQQALSAAMPAKPGLPRGPLPASLYTRQQLEGGLPSPTTPRSQMLHPPESPQGTPATPSEVESKRLKHLNDRQTQDQEALLKVIVSEVGFDSSRPVVACVTYKALLHWRSFEAERTSVFDRIIQTIGGAIENQQSNERLAYWLANTSCLLFLLQRTLKASGAPGSQAQRRRSGMQQTTLFGRMTQSFRGGSPTTPTGVVGASGGLEHIPQVDAKYPALLFKQQLTAYVEKIYGMIRDNLKKEISPTLAQCIQAPRISRAAYGRHSSHRGAPVATATHALSSHWGSIIATLTTLLTTLKASHVPSFLVRKLVTQIFSFINVQLFNSLLLRRECCSFSNGEYVKAGLGELDHWLHEATHEYTGNAWEELKYIRQAVGFLVIHQKPKKSMQEITSDLCPALSIQQLYRISTMYWDDKYGTHTVSSEVISEMRRRMSDENSASVSNSFLLDDDSSNPFSVEDILKSTHEIDLLSFLSFSLSLFPFEFPSILFSVEDISKSTHEINPLSLTSPIPLSLPAHPSIPFSVEDISKSTHEIDLRSLQLPPAIRDNSTFQFLLTH
ncbi:unnamed protein product [Closterium sp. NIES-65]|nr:unnamed protein product [Closterium sp. NIES-65]